MQSNSGHSTRPGPAGTFVSQYLVPLGAMLAAFVVYYCMYAFRKPFGAATWEGEIAGMQMKTALAVSQVIGYAAAKLWGTQVCSGVRHERLIYVLFACIAAAGLSLLALPFAGPWKFVPMFFNGLSLGMVWGIVMRPLEGRRLTEMLIAGLCVSFIIASGDVKSMGQWVMAQSWFKSTFDGDVAWMPFVTAMFYLPFLIVGSILLYRVPRPTELDRMDRHERRSMDATDRWYFIRHHFSMLIPLAIAYFVLTAYRDYRDTFQAEMFTGLGITNKDAFSSSERMVAFGVVIVLSIFIVIKRSRLALWVCHGVMAGGLIVCGAVTWLHASKMLDGFQWMVLSGMGAYACYLAFHCIIFERMVAVTRSPGNSVFAMMIFDFIGYVAAVLIMIAKNLSVFSHLDHLQFFTGFTWLLTIAGTGGVFCSMVQIPWLKALDKPAS